MKAKRVMKNCSCHAYKIKQRDIVRFWIVFRLWGSDELTLQGTKRADCAQGLKFDLKRMSEHPFYVHK